MQEIELPSSSNGRVSGKSWKTPRLAVARSQMSKGLKSKSFEARMEKAKHEQAIKQLQNELKEEKKEDLARRRQITQERRQAAEERQRLEEDKAKMGARRAARLRRKAGRTKKING